MKVTATDRAARVVERMRAKRSGRLTITIGTGCCESTAPFLYEDFWPGPDQEVVDLLKEGQLVLVFPLEDAVEETAGAVAKLKRESGRNAKSPVEERGKQIF